MSPPVAALPSPEPILADALCPSPHPGLPHPRRRGSPSLVPVPAWAFPVPFPSGRGLCLGSLVLSSARKASASALTASPATGPAVPRHLSRRPQTPLSPASLGAPARHPSFLTWVLQGPCCLSVLFGPWSDFSTTVFFSARTHFP